ncbi:MAG: hypothetical protein ACOX44_06765 [Limnochordia bacterium]|jgi:hypothetical protein
MANECSLYYKRVFQALEVGDSKEAERIFWAGILTGICEQVMMRVKPAGMVTAQTEKAEQIAAIVCDVYQLHCMRLDKPTGGYEIWVCRLDDEETTAALAQLKTGRLDWGQYHALRGRLCGYPEEAIRHYTDGVWP